MSKKFLMVSLRLRIPISYPLPFYLIVPGSIAFLRLAIFYSFDFLRIRAGLCFLKDSGRQMFSVVCGEATDKHVMPLHFLIRLDHSLSNCLKRNRYLRSL